MKKYIVLFVLFALVFQPASALASQTSTSNSTTCEYILTPSFQDNCSNNDVQIFKQQGDQLSIKIDADNYNTLFFQVTYDDQPTDWSVHISDSISGNGYGGDAGTQSRDAELHITNKTLYVYGNDHTPTNQTLDGHRRIAHVGQTVEKDDTVTIMVKDGVANVRGPHVLYQSDPAAKDSLFDLTGKSDFEGSANTDIYASFNTTLSGGNRTGSGVHKVVLSLQEKTSQSSSSTSQSSSNSNSGNANQISNQSDFEAVSRGAFAKYIVEAKNWDSAAYDDTDCGFEDEVAGEWQTEYLCVLEAKGFISGDNEYIHPMQNITYAEVTKILSYVYDLPSESHTFTDLSNHWSYEYAGYFQKHNLLARRQGTVFAPNSLILKKDIIDIIDALSIQE